MELTGARIIMECLLEQGVDTIFGYPGGTIINVYDALYDYQGKKNVSGDMIRQLRVKNRMSQNDLAARVQVEGVMLERDSISRIESGARFVADYELFVFAKVLGVDVASLLEFQETKSKAAGNGRFFLLFKAVL